MLKKSKLRFFSLIKKLMFENYKFVLILLLNKKGLPVGSKPKNNFCYAGCKKFYLSLMFCCFFHSFSLVWFAKAALRGCLFAF